MVVTCKQYFEESFLSCCFLLTKKPITFTLQKLFRQYEFNSMKMHNQGQTLEFEPNITDNFLDWDSFLGWVDSKCKMYSTLQKVKLGNTYEKREMLLLKLSTGGNKPAAFIMGGEQGRDWMSTAIILNFLNNLLENPHDSLLKHFDFYFVPVFNPDGYEHSMKHVSICRLG